MLNLSALNLDTNNSLQTISLKLILKLPKKYAIGTVLLSLITLTGIELNPIGKLTGLECDLFNWCYLEITGQVSELIDATSYLQALQGEIQIIALNSRTEFTI
jgi:hypothetical protein